MVHLEARLLDEEAPSSDDDHTRRGSSVSYHKLNAIFHRTFPMADELDIAVESFVIASSSTDTEELQPADGLSISQVEVLQEAHLKAYHYLNEKKVREQKQKVLTCVSSTDGWDAILRR